jgi:elongation factor P
MKIDAGNLKKGQFISYNNEVWQVQKAEFYSPGKGSALMKTTLKNVSSDKTLSYTFKSNEGVETLDVDVIELQYLYKDNNFLYFMNERSYEQYQLNLSLAGNVSDYLKEGDKLYVLIHENKPLSLRPPQTVRLKVIKAEEAVKGDTVTGAKKIVTVETGAKVAVPLFIKVDDTIVIKPETGEYIERVGKQY